MSQHRLRRGDSHPAHRRSQITHVFKHDAALASQHGLAYYEASYVALVEALTCALVTADERLVRRTRGSGLVRLLSAERDHG